MMLGEHEFIYLSKNGLDGLYWREHREKNHIDHFISSRVEVVAMVRDTDSASWGRQIVYRDQDGEQQTYTMRFANITRDCDTIIGFLRDHGLLITSNGNCRKLVDFIHNVKVERKLRTTDLSGWHERKAFVLPGRTIGTTDEDLIFSNDNLRLKPFLSSGTLTDWQENIARYCVGNHVLAFAACTAFAAPLLHIVHQENGGFNLMGDSSIGKSTALAVATSVFGNPKDATQRWNMTINSLEGVAKAYNDFMLPLDEIGQSTANQIGEIIYMLGNGSGKGRANVHGEARKRVQFRTLFLSNGEKTLEEHMGDASKKVKAGQEVRLVDFPANCDLNLGIYQHIFDFQNSRIFNDTLLHNTKHYHGTAFDEFIRQVIANLDTVQAEIKAFIDRFIQQHVPKGADSQVLRIASRFALLSIAGLLATKYGVTGWPEDEAEKAVLFCFRKWLSQRGNVGQSEKTRLISQVQKFFEANSDARFTRIGDKFANAIRDRVGFKDMDQADIRFFVLPNQLDVIIKGFSKTSAVKILIAEGYIIPDKQGKATMVKRLPGFEKPKKVYEFSSKVLAEEEDEAVTDAAISGGNKGNGVTSE